MLANGAASRVAAPGTRDAATAPPLETTAPDAEALQVCTPAGTPQKENAHQTCSNFELDVAATTFNICKNCQHPRAAHQDYSLASAELKGKLGRRQTKLSQQSPRSALKRGISPKEAGRSVEVCKNFRRDLSGTSFDTCVCGFPKSAHIVKTLTTGAGNELAAKLGKKGSSAGDDDDDDDRGGTREPCACSCVVS